MGTKVKIVEVGLRDGLQNESTILNPSVRLSIAERLASAGIKNIELGAFVSPHWVPQMADSKRLIRKALRMQGEGFFPSGVRFSALVPNERGMTDAVSAGVEEIAVFAAASESFSRKNINCTFVQSLKRFESVIRIAKREKIKVRGYLSTAFGCPYEGKVSEARVVKCAEAMMKLGIYELSIGDTIGAANPKQVRSLVPKLSRVVPVNKLALHMHDTRGLSLANILAGLDLDIRVFDSSIGGLGGCPYAPGASGNVSTEDVVNMLNGLGMKTGVDIDQLVELSRWIEPKIQHELPSRVAKSGVFVADR